MRRNLPLLGLLLAGLSAIGCHCVTGKCDCVGDALLTHPYSAVAAAQLQINPPAPPLALAPTGYPGMLAPTPEQLGMPREDKK